MQFTSFFIFFIFYCFINVHKAPAHAHQIFSFIVTYKFSPAPHVSRTTSHNTAQRAARGGARAYGVYY